MKWFIPCGMKLFKIQASIQVGNPCCIWVLRVQGLRHQDKAGAYRTLLLWKGVCVFCITLHHTSRPIDSTSRQQWPYNFDLAKARHITASGRRLSHAPLVIESYHEIAQQLPTQGLTIYTDSNCRKWNEQHQPARGVFVPSFPTVKFARPI